MAYSYLRSREGGLQLGKVLKPLGAPNNTAFDTPSTRCITESSYFRRLPIGESETAAHRVSRLPAHSHSISRANPARVIYHWSEAQVMNNFLSRSLM